MEARRPGAARAVLLFFSSTLLFSLEPQRAFQREDLDRVQPPGSCGANLTVPGRGAGFEPATPRAAGGRPLPLSSPPCPAPPRLQGSLWRPRAALAGPPSLSHALPDWLPAPRRPMGGGLLRRRAARRGRHLAAGCGTGGSSALRRAMPHYQAWEEFTRAAEKLYLADPMKVSGGRPTPRPRPRRAPGGGVGGSRVRPQLAAGAARWLRSSRCGVLRM